MRDDAKLNAAYCELQARCPKRLSRWWHRNGDVYIVTGPAVIEATLEPAVSYLAVVSFPDSVPWIRPLEEFLDRFTPIGEEL